MLETYFNQCAVRLNCVHLARAGLFLANDGVDPIAGQRVVDAQAVRRINAIMMTCGHYDASGDFAFRVGLPGKSGVGGGILAIAPRRAAIAVWSPGLNTAGNSLLGALALESLARRAGWGRLASYASGGGSLSISLTARRRNFICSSTVRQVWQMTK